MGTAPPVAIGRAARAPAGTGRVAAPSAGWRARLAGSPTCGGGGSGPACAGRDRARPGDRPGPCPSRRRGGGCPSSLAGLLSRMPHGDGLEARHPEDRWTGPRSLGEEELEHPRRPELRTRKTYRPPPSASPARELSPRAVARLPPTKRRPGPSYRDSLSRPARGSGVRPGPGVSRPHQPNSSKSRPFAATAWCIPRPEAIGHSRCKWGESSGRGGRPHGARLHDAAKRISSEYLRSYT